MTTLPGQDRSHESVLNITLARVPPPGTYTRTALILVLIIQGTIELANFKLPVYFAISCDNVSCIED